MTGEAKRPKRRRSNDKQEFVAHALRKAMAGNQYRPGDRLPPQEELAATYDVSGYTVQRALKQLTREGFVFGQPKSGTRVVQRPPYVYRYAMMIPATPDRKGRWSQFYTAMLQEAEEITANTDLEISHFFVHDWRLPNPEYERLTAEARLHRFAGVIFLDSPAILAETELMQIEHLPRVTMKSGGLPPQVDASIGVNYSSFYERALADLKERGCRRIGVMNQDTDPHAFWQDFSRRVEAHGLETRLGWVNYLPPRTSGWARNLVHLLMERPRDDRPDGLILADDNFVENTTLALMELGEEVRKDLRIVAFANYSYLQPAALPVRWLGTNDAAMLHKAIQTIDDLRENRDVAKTVHLEPVFTEEYAASRPALPPPS